ncbi:hypothetical protein [Breoghania sp.]|uniref:efflux RND transporter periplasmic adaptor subunit n=1 Tax=Breoghania sp. TaxID=2065378 RepID=UPI002604108E|nr:hypothetical protein [Breoghania sp.]MDJ0932908.1 hypothetical protein [Breoghania sp.]
MLKSIETDTGNSADEPAAEPASPAADASPVGRGKGAALIFARAILQIAIASGVLAAAVFAYFHLLETREGIPSRAERERVYVVRTVPAVVSNEQPMLTLYGEVVAAHTVDLRALVAGKIVKVGDNLQAGAAVDAGDRLVEIDRFAYEGAVVEVRANLAEVRAKLIEAEGELRLEIANADFAREQLAFAERDLERGRKLLERGSATERTLDDRALIVSQRRQQLDQRQSGLSVQQARVEQQKAAIERLEWKLEEAEQALADTALTAPFDAVVPTEAAEVGRLVNVNDVIAVLYDRNASPFSL